MLVMSTLFELQGHRGARGLKPENTLPGFEVAFDLGVSSIETDIHLTRDGQPVLVHEPVVSDRLFHCGSGPVPFDPTRPPLVSSLTLAELARYRADRNPDPQRFPGQDARVTPLARLFAERHAIDPYAPPTLPELFAFAQAYAGELGAVAGKTATQRARRVRFDLELKRVPFCPHVIGDTFDGSAPGLLEQRVVEAVRAAEMLERTSVRSFDHRSVRALRALEPRLPGAVLVAATAPMGPARLAQEADAQVYCPAVEFLDRGQVRQLHDAGIRVVPWTVNEPEDWKRLLDWDIDGITTDFPDRLADLLRQRGQAF
jgi:glycerophosphoryl diester phosphodiesterase